ncbi:NAD(P)-binding protein [Lepidopterella palustris CBS 459.81]|uniref:NAD(P)-binding protein n=1 Tax=Lepidopterella palustris CBS 459.81 TaxID=1314670 RepID=A0A8E2DXA8_9PEZI|nr:NAD(P)-binding protein [Lepidopterella palustris CBS 459.81]
MSTNVLKYTSKLTGKNILVFGGTSGIDFCVAEASLEYGATVTISSSNPSRLSTALSRLRTSYPSSSITGYTCDVSDLSDLSTLEENLTTLLDKVTENGAKKIDHIAFTAGDALSLPIVKNVTPTTLFSLANVRFVAPIFIAKLIPSYMSLAPASSFTITGGVNSSKPAPGWAIAAAWGSAIEGLMRGLTVDLAPMRVNVVVPSAVKTEIFERLGTERMETVLKDYAIQTTVGDIGKPEDVAETYLYAMKDQFVTGSVLESNGGRLLVYMDFREGKPALPVHNVVMKLEFVQSSVFCVLCLVSRVRDFKMRGSPCGFL